jgi:N,N'-diacetyllegionaminate synthase
MLKNLELSFDEFIELKEYCDKKNIEFMSTPYDPESVEFLNKIVHRFKIPSADIVNKPLLQAVAETKKQVILSTGMALIEEIDRAVDLLKENGNKNIILLHCTTSYPASIHEVNLNIMQSLKNRYNLPVGYSDHTIGIEIPIMAASLGAVLIEKHFTLNRKMKGPDHYCSLEPNELKNMVNSVRNIEKAFGKKEKHITKEEEKNIYHLRRSIHSLQDIKKGEKIDNSNLGLLRPDDGLSPWYMDDIVGKKAKKDIKKFEPIKEGDV